MAEEMKNETVETKDVENTDAKDSTTEKKPSLEDQLKALMIENAKLKKATDKATSEAASFKKQLREKQSADEIAIQEKAERELEREEQFQALLRENQVNKFEKNFVILGYTETEANKAAIAQYDGDTDSLFKIQADVQARMLKEKENEWLASRPDVNAGVGSEQTTITKEQFLNMSFAEKVQFKNKYPETYRKYMS